VLFVLKFQHFGFRSCPIVIASTSTRLDFHWSSPRLGSLISRLLGYLTHSHFMCLRLGGKFPRVFSWADELHPTNPQRPAPQKPTQSSCAMKRLRRLPVRDGSPALAEVGEAGSPVELLQTVLHGAIGRDCIAPVTEPTRRHLLQPIASGQRS
jgi:hypothetical protein